ncbi:hypothetical protein Hsar01_01818 [Haloferula sargassicola]|uniref:Uncharacterized protein n=1 Tax=Haloferula sargassicola TaxID=490096 RepID=A0ABP9ULX8_9BACT
MANPSGMRSSMSHGQGKSLSWRGVRQRGLGTGEADGGKQAMRDKPRGPAGLRKARTYSDSNCTDPGSNTHRLGIEGAPTWIELHRPWIELHRPWIELAPTRDRRRTYPGLNTQPPWIELHLLRIELHLPRIERAPTLDRTRTYPGSNSHLPWIEHAPTLGRTRTYPGSDTHLPWIGHAPTRDRDRRRRKRISVNVRTLPTPLPGLGFPGGRGSHGVNPVATCLRPVGALERKQLLRESEHGPVGDRIRAAWARMRACPRSDAHRPGPNAHCPGPNTHLPWIGRTPSLDRTRTSPGSNARLPGLASTPLSLSLPCQHPSPIDFGVSVRDIVDVPRGLCRILSSQEAGRMESAATG